MRRALGNICTFVGWFMVLVSIMSMISNDRMFNPGAATPPGWVICTWFVGFIGGLGLMALGSVAVPKDAARPSSEAESRRCR